MGTLFFDLDNDEEWGCTSTYCGMSGDLCDYCYHMAINDRRKIGEEDEDSNKR